ncbi:MAG: aldo/keto reductase [Paracoccaceae bacterium]
MTMLTTQDGSAVPPFAFGTMQFGGTADESASRAMFDACRAVGIRHFDTAYVYTDGASETLLGRFAAAERDTLFIATKCGNRVGTPKAMTAEIDESLRRLGTDVVDLLYLHRWTDDAPLEARVEVLARAVDTGKARHVGLSNFAAWQVMKAIRIAAGFGLEIAALQPMYNLVKRQAEVEILPMARSEGLAVFPYSPLGGGLLTGKYATGTGEGRIASDARYARRYGADWMHRAATGLADIAAEIGVPAPTLAVAWAARHPGVTGPILSARDTLQLAPSLDALGFDMDDALYARLTALSPAPPPATDRNEEA